MNIDAIKKEICDIGKRMYEREFVAANDGNISVRISDTKILTTPTGVSKGFMTPDMIATVDIHGNILSKNLQPSSEIKMHLKVYQERSDIYAVVHAHPITATAYSICGTPFDKPYMPELVVNLGVVPIAPYATPSTEEVPNSIEPFLKDYNAVLLSNHGALTWGKNLLDAYFKMESLEFAAKIITTANIIGKPQYIPSEKMQALIKIRESLGIVGKVPN